MSLKKEFEIIKNVIEERLDKIFQYEGCYARAIRSGNGKDFVGMPQEVRECKIKCVSKEIRLTHFSIL